MTAIVSHETYTLDSRIYRLFDISKEYIISICHNTINNAKYSLYNMYGHMGQYMPYTRISHIGHNIVHIVRHIVHIIHMPYIVHILRHIRVPNLKIKLKIKFLLSHINISNRNRK